MSFIQPFIPFITLLLIVVIAIQVGRISELSSKIKGEAESFRQNNLFNGRMMVVFVVLFLVACVLSALYYQNYMLGYGPHESASEHGEDLDFIFNLTLFFTGIVFIVTQIALFWFGFKYREREGHKGVHISHDNKLEIVWTAIPAVVMAFLVIQGLDIWNETMADVKPTMSRIAWDAETQEYKGDYIEVEATGYQFAWDLRHPGKDGYLGEKYYKNIDPANNPIGQVWTDEKNIDDFFMDTLMLPVNTKVRVRITSKDVLHNFYLPHFRVKMDAVPGMPTHFVFVPRITTEEYREKLKNVPEYNVPADPSDPNGLKKWEAFEYELACAELCGNSHYSMQRIVRVVSKEDYEEWLDWKQKDSNYLKKIRNTEEDPFKGKTLRIEKELAAKANRPELPAKEEAVDVQVSDIDTSSVDAPQMELQDTTTTNE